MPNGWRDSVPIERKIDKRLLDRAIGELAGQQHGVVARTQLVAIGLGPSSIEMRLARRRLHRVHQGVYAVGHSCLSEKGRWMAAVLAGGPRAVLSHAPAGALWGIRPQGDLEVVVTGPRRVEPRRWMRFHRSSLPDDEITIKDGIPVTTAPRTLFDLAAVVSHGQLARAINEAEIRRLWDPLSLHDLLSRHPRRPGAAALRAVLATPGANITRSDLEDLFLRLLGAARLPRPETNVRIEVNGVWIEADCVWRQQRLVVELDSHTYHSTRASFESDRARDRALIAAGWRVMRITWRQLNDEPAALTRDVRASLAARPGANLGQE
jgi:very-short-patch-repair endonuclease/predicted transcriptional regulator of viral defense system